MPLGLNFNQIQCFVLLALVAQITGHKPGKAFHKIINAHIYENQLPLMRDVQLKKRAIAVTNITYQSKNQNVGRY